MKNNKSVGTLKQHILLEQSSCVDDGKSSYYCETATFGPFN